MTDKAGMYPILPSQVPVQDGQIAPPPTYDQTFVTPGAPAPGPLNYQQPTQPMVVQPTVVFTSGIPPLGPHPVTATCPNCGQRANTEVRYENGTKTHVIALILCLFGLCCCACVPYCVDSCRNANHYCKNCQQYLGTHQNGSL